MFIWDPVEMEFGLECSILNGQEVCTKKSKLKIADMWFIPLDRVTYTFTIEVQQINELVLNIDACPVDSALQVSFIRHIKSQWACLDLSHFPCKN